LREFQCDETKPERQKLRYLSAPILIERRRHSTKLLKLSTLLA